VPASRTAHDGTRSGWTGPRCANRGRMRGERGSEGQPAIGPANPRARTRPEAHR
jgi:hypothetical protein